MSNRKVPRNQYKKPYKVSTESLEQDFSSFSVDGHAPIYNSNSEIFYPSFCKSDVGEFSNSGEFGHIALDSSNPQGLAMLARSKAGSKKLQQMIARSRPEEIENIVEALAGLMGELMVDIYGNYMCQTLVQSCSGSQRLKLLHGMQSSLINISCDGKGTHALQNLISLSNLREEEQVYQQAFTGNIVRLSKHPNATHVIQRLLVTVNNKHFIIKEVLGNITELSIDKLGLCVIKKCVNDPQVFTEILGNCLILMQDPYGNYAVQCILESWKEECAFEFTSNIQKKVGQLCIQKYASNVMEKAMKIEEIRKIILKELITDEKLDLLLGSPYGCYVLRTAALESNWQEKAELKLALNNITQRLHNSKLQIQWDEIIEILS